MFFNYISCNFKIFNINTILAKISQSKVTSLRRTESTNLYSSKLSNFESGFNDDLKNGFVLARLTCKIKKISELGTILMHLCIYNVFVLFLKIFEYFRIK